MQWNSFRHTKSLEIHQNTRRITTLFIFCRPKWVGEMSTTGFTIAPDTNDNWQPAGQTRCSCLHTVHYLTYTPPVWRVSRRQCALYKFTYSLIRPMTAYAPTAATMNICNYCWSFENEVLYKNTGWHKLTYPAVNLQYLLQWHKIL